MAALLCACARVDGTDDAPPRADAAVAADAAPAPGDGALRCEDMPFRSLPFCPKDEGVCAGARFHCEDGRAAPCEEADYAAYHAGYANPETEAHCDGLDNDCDGRTDEACACVTGTTQPCGAGLGACEAGEQHCTDGAWGPCEGEVGPADESCNGTDDDCDGQVDEDTADLAPPCAQATGVCAGARQRCGGVPGFVACDAARLAAHDLRYAPDETDQHCDGADNDCDGLSDEGCACDPAAPPRACGASVGECRAGEQTCDRGFWSPCDGAGPRPEACSDRDEDCDGRVDEGVTCPERHACVAGACVRTGAVVRAASGARGHDTGREARGGWCATAGVHPEGFLCDGPYLNDLPAGEYEATWRLLVGGEPAPDAEVARLDVNDYDGRPSCGDCALAERAIRGADFAAAGQWQEFALRFSNPGGGHRIELRTWWPGGAYLCEDQVEVRRVLP